ncbi:M10 family metallopeptidase domain-containing protein [Mechercharimyces sp. CAU 1602]|uniref:M10 family metallopeptidase domain-containing protein n=1 Tax=Mechercharimyces sp. CAU 1602 TaxID=2973933 RepID=UPI002163D4F8|nr:M10 family metallopeptidase domain-containing protein [Mechercharimyces sp. CAU 1602]MCS1351344.1 M10 family metallopeptidase domain-containing protein [Mechercharimyces sp. CAU 1602]
MAGPTFDGTKVGKFPIGITVSPFSATLKSIYQKANYNINYTDLESILNSITEEAVEHWNKRLEVKAFELRVPSIQNNGGAFDCALGENNIVVYPYIYAETPLSMGGTLKWFKNESGDQYSPTPSNFSSTPSKFPFPINSGTVKINFFALDKKFSEMVVQHTVNSVKSVPHSTVNVDGIKKAIGTDDFTVNGWSYLFTVIHELGHVLGLDHTDDTRSVMYKGFNHLVHKPYSEKKLELSSIDIGPVKELYQL